MSTDTANQKSVIRKFALITRKKTYQKKDESSQKDVIEIFEKNIIPLLSPNPLISAYLPINSELNPNPLMFFLRDKYKAELCLPVIVRKGEALIFRSYSKDCEMEQGPFKTSHPKHGEALSPDVIISPLLAFDKKGFRLGYGGGFYDRTFALHKKSLKLGLAFSEQVLTNPLPKNEFDHPLDGVITPDKYWKFNGQ